MPFSSIFICEVLIHFNGREAVVNTLTYFGQFLSDTICTLQAHSHHSVGGISAYPGPFRTNSKNLSLSKADQVLRHTTLWYFVE